MKKTIILCILMVVAAHASQRTVVAEQFTATWCTYCPGASRALDEIYNREYNSLVVISYHPSTSDPFYSAEAGTRFSYYSVTGYPTSWFDGAVNVVGGLHYGTMYPSFYQRISSRLTIDSPFEITLTCNYDTTANTGDVTAEILNTTGSPVSGNLHFVIVENDIPYSWQGMSKLDFLMRDMLPDASGEAVTVPASDTIIRNRSFSTSAGWDEYNCKIVVFVQASNRQIYQGADIALVQEPEMEYYGTAILETAGNGNGFAEPGESWTFRASAKNLGDGVYSGSVGVQCTDPNITITGTTPLSVSIGPGDVDTVVEFTFDISGACPNPHEVNFTLDFGTSTDDIPFIITTQTGFSDDIESGQGEWTHSGTRDYWHITEYKSSSPTHSWYSGIENSWVYIDESDASLVSPYFVATPDSSLRLNQWYYLESGYDYGYIEIDNGSGWWSTLSSINGTNSGWGAYTYSVAGIDGQTIRLRFRFISDYNVHYEGWYVDDVCYPIYVGVAEYENDEPQQTVSLQVTPNPFSKLTTINFSTIQSDKNIELSIYDASGRLVRQFGHPTMGLSNCIVWNGSDQRGRSLPAGVYYVRLNTDENTVLEKAILLR